MVKFCFSGLNVHIFPSHGLELEINLSVHTSLLSIPETECALRRTGPCTEMAVSTQRTHNILLSGATVSPGA